MKFPRIVALVLFLVAASLARADKPEYPGIWGIWGEPLSREGRPWYKGHGVTVEWSEIEPANGKFDWSKLDAAVTNATSKGLHVMVMVYTGMRSPPWLYSSGVPKVSTDFNGGSDFPFYLDEDFKRYFKRMIDAFAAHLDRDLPPDVRRRIIAVQCPVGASGDPHPYKVEAEKGSGQVGAWGSGATKIERPQWIEYQREMFAHYYAAFARAKPMIHCLFNSNSDDELHAWALKSFPGMWVKTARIGDRYQNNGEAREDNYQTTLPRLISTFQDGMAIRARSEMDLTTRKWFTDAPLWGMYWTQLWGLHNFQDIHNQVSRDLQNPDYYPAFEFYSRYAGYKDPRDSHGAWCALRDGIDYADTERFPEAKFGEVGRGENRARYDAIVATMKPFGAAQSATGYARRTNWNGMDDVGFDIFRGNYELYLSQIAPNETSQGLWRVGPKDQVYGRFARRFDHATGRDAMFFNINDGFFFDEPLNGRYEVEVRVVYFDEGRGQWALRYDAVGAPAKTALTVTKTGSGRWQEARVTLRDGFFGNRGARGSDLSLVNVDGEDDTFHLIEITRKTGDRKGHWGD
jgi:hypothetical protein